MSAVNETHVSSNQIYMLNNINFINVVLYLQSTSSVFLHCLFHNSQIDIKGSNITSNMFVESEWMGEKTVGALIDGARTVHFSNIKFVNINSLRAQVLSLKNNNKVFVRNCLFKNISKSVMLLENSDFIGFSNMAITDNKFTDQTPKKILFLIVNSKLFTVTNSYFSDITSPVMRILGITDVEFVNSIFVNCFRPLKITVYKNAFNITLLLQGSLFISCSCKSSGGSLILTLGNVSYGITNADTDRRDKAFHRILHLSIKQMVFYSCHSQLNGGALAIQLSHFGENAFIYITNSLFFNNTSGKQGGSAFITYANFILIKHCKFMINKGGNGNGGALLLYNINQILCAYNSFYRNTAFGCGGAISIKIVQLPCISTWFNSGHLVDLYPTGIPTVVTSKYHKSQRAIIYRTIFTENFASFQSPGGAVYMTNACKVKLAYRNRMAASSDQYMVALIEEAKFILNSASEAGGAIQLEKISKCYIVNSSFTQNRAIFQGNGGALCFYSGKILSVHRVRFQLNSASATGGAIHLQQISKCSVTNSCFKQNSAFSYGGGMNFYFGAILSMHRVRFVNNSALAPFRGTGGAIYLEQIRKCSVLFSNFVGNKALGGSGGIGLYNGNAIIVYRAKFMKNIGFAWPRGGTVIQMRHILNCSVAISYFVGRNSLVSADNGETLTVHQVRFTCNIRGNLLNVIALISFNFVSILNSSFVVNKGLDLQVRSKHKVVITVTRVTRSKFYYNSAIGEVCGIRIHHVAKCFLGYFLFKCKIRGIYADDGLFLSMQSLTFINNNVFRYDFGGAIAIINIPVCFIAGTTFIGNRAVTYGGGIHVKYCRKISLYKVKFLYNSAGSGAGISFHNVTRISVANSFFVGNNAGQCGGGLHYDGSSGGRINIHRVSFINNAVTMDGGAVWVKQIYKCSVVNSLFVGNKAESGGGIDGKYGLRITMYKVKFINNSVSVIGGSTRLENISYYVVTHSSFVNNVIGNDITATRGGAIHNFNCHKFHCFNSVFTNNAIRAIHTTKGGAAIIKNCVLKNNKAGNGGAMLVDKYKLLTIINSKYLLNSAFDAGGSIYTKKVEKHILLNSSFYGNQAISGGSIYVISSELNIIAFSFFKKNSANFQGGCLFFEKMSKVSQSKMIVNDAYFLDSKAKEQGVVMCISFINQVYFSRINVTSTSKTFASATIINVHCTTLIFARLIFINPYKHVNVLELYFNLTFAIKNITIICSEASYLAEHSVLNGLVEDMLVFYKCETCNKNQYILKFAWSFSREIRYKVLPLNQKLAFHCDICPANAVCYKGNITVLPNYWGHVVGHKVYVLPCPADYCCQKAPCVSYDSCNIGRQEILCSQCRSNFSLSLKTNKCHIRTGCSPVLFWFCFALNIIIYSTFLFIRNDLLNILFCSLKWLYRRIKYLNNILLKKTKHNSSQFVEDKQYISIKLEKWANKISFFVIWQIFVYHIQDVCLLQVDWKFMPIKKFDIITQFEQKLKNIIHITSIFPKGICLPELDFYKKVFFTVSGPPIVVICLLLGSALLKYSKKETMKSQRNRAFLAILLAVMYSNQKITSALFSLVHCILIDNVKHLFIFGEVKCFQIWQIVIIVYIATVTVPRCFVFLIGPELLSMGKIGKWQFIVALFCPLPNVIHWLFLTFWKKQKQTLKYNPQNLSTLAILEEVQSPFKRNEAPFSFCWMGFIELQRLSLVLCDLFILDKVHSYFAKSVICLLALVSVNTLKPYKNEYSNIFASICLFSQVIVGMCSSLFSVARMHSISEQIIPSMELVLYIEQLSCVLLPLAVSLFCTFFFTVKIKFVTKSKSDFRLKPICQAADKEEDKEVDGIQNELLDTVLSEETEMDRNTIQNELLDTVSSKKTELYVKTIQNERFVMVLSEENEMNGKTIQNELLDTVSSKKAEMDVKTIQNELLDMVSSEEN